MYDPNRPNRPRSFLGDFLGFNPLAVMPPPTALGMEIQRTDQGYRVEIPVAGFRPEDITVTVEENQLTVAGKNERRRFTQVLVLPEEIDVSRIEANVDHGMLTLNLPLQPRVQPRRIDVRVGGNQLSGQSGDSGSVPISGGTDTSAAGTSGATKTPTVSGETAGGGTTSETRTPAGSTSGGTTSGSGGTSGSGTNK